jgi:hypothetical protein
MFLTIPLSIIRSFLLYTQQRYMSYSFADSLWAGANAPAHKLSANLTYTIVVCTVKNSWWWTKELCETCRVLFQNKFEKLVHLFAFIIRVKARVVDAFSIVLYIKRNHVAFSSPSFVRPCPKSGSCFWRSSSLPTPSLVLQWYTVCTQCDLQLRRGFLINLHLRLNERRGLLVPPPHPISLSVITRRDKLINRIVGVAERSTSWLSVGSAVENESFAASGI